MRSGLVAGNVSQTNKSEGGIKSDGPMRSHRLARSAEWLETCLVYANRDGENDDEQRRFRDRDSKIEITGTRDEEREG